jgi:mannosyltransferase
MQFVLALVILLLAFGLRVYRLDTQSFAFDEGWTSYAIHHSWRDMWRVLAPDNHPPLYYAAVKAVAEVAGYNDFSVRMLSVLLGTALVAALYVLGRALSGPVGGLAAALLAACSPLLIYYAQEARMYSLLMLLVALSSYSLVRLARRPPRSDAPHSDAPHGNAHDLGRLAAYVLPAAGALYTHYFAVLILLAHNLVAAVWLLRDPFLPKERVPGTPHPLARWSLTQAAITVLYLPWLPVAIRQVTIGQGTWWRVPLPAKMIAKDTWRFLILGPRRPDVPVFGPALGGMAALVVVALLGALLSALLGRQGTETGAKGSARIRARRPLGPTFYALSLWLVPAAAILIASSRELGFALPIYTDRYTLVAAPGLVLTAGMGVAALWQAFSRPDRFSARFSSATCQAFSLLLLAAAVVGPLPHLYHYYHDPAYWREDFRRAAQYAMDTTGPGDAVILVGAYQPVMQYYRGEAAVVRFPQQGDSVQDEAAVARALNEAITPESRVRLIMYSWPTVDPQSLVEGMLRSECQLEGEHWQRETGERPIKVLNLADCASFAVEPRQPLDAVFGYPASEQAAARQQDAAGAQAGQLALTAYRAIHLQPGEQAHVFLWWRALRRPLRNYSAFVHLVGQDGQIIAQFDHLPLSDFFPMQAWPVGTDYRDDYPMRVPSDADLQGARLEVGLYDRASKERLPVYVGGEPSGDAVRIPLTAGP